MKKFLVVVLVGALALCALLSAACGSTDKQEVRKKAEDTEVENLDEPVSEGIVGVFYECVSGDASAGARSIVFEAGGNFGGDVWGTARKGTYKVKESEDGNSVTLEFDEGASETWGIMIADGKVVAVTNPDGEQYTKRPDNN